MKVVGTGAPLMLTVRVKQAEIALWRNVLCDRQDRVSSDATGSDDARPADEPGLITNLLHALRQPVPDGQPLELVGPTWLLDSVIRDVASEAAEQLSEAIDVFRSGRKQLTADALRARADTALASTATLIRLDHVQRHAVEGNHHESA
jgi:hypothetical protein